MCGKLSWWETEEDEENATTKTDENGKPVADNK
jgi:hypothetical protein